jgi:hypothetical protein
MRLVMVTFMLSCIGFAVWGAASLLGGGGTGQESGPEYVAALGFGLVLAIVAALKLTYDQSDRS